MTLLGPVRVPVEEKEEEHVSLKKKTDKPFEVRIEYDHYDFKAGKFTGEKKFHRHSHHKRLKDAEKSASDAIRSIEERMYDGERYHRGVVKILGPETEKTMMARFMPKIGHWTFNGEVVSAEEVYRNHQRFEWKEVPGMKYLMPFTRRGYFAGRWHRDEKEKKA